MQLASRGASGLQTTRQALYRSMNHNPVRHIHIPRINTRLSPGKRLASQSRHFFSKFISYLTAPGLGVRSVTPSYHASARTSIQQRLTFPVRSALNRQTFLPRSPTVPRSVFQVGLGTARNFSSSRPVFENLVQNVPVIGRALCEADVDIKKSRKAAQRLHRSKASPRRKQVHPSFKIKEIQAPRALEAESEFASDIERYFPEPHTVVSTFLCIPMAPTPTGRRPLPEYTPEHDPLLPLPTLGNIHMTHEMHALRVSSLFSRLDAANVWDRNVQCSAFSYLGNGHGSVCDFLKIEFTGWTMAEVRSVLGESGTGWCSLEEVNTEPAIEYDDDDYRDDSGSDTSSVLSGVMSDESLGVFSQSEDCHAIEPSNSLIIPTLDLSASSVDSTQTRTPSTPPVISRSSSGSSQGLSDWHYIPDSSEDVIVGAPMTDVNGSLMEFSADFLSRYGDQGGPMESVF